jgi:chloride channel protein, CIC family
MARPQGGISARAGKLLGLADFGFIGRWVGIASLIGFLAGLVAVFFRWLTSTIAYWALERPLGIFGEGLDHLTPRSWWLLLVPALGGIVVGWLTQRFAPEAEGHGTEKMIRTFHRFSGAVRQRVVAFKVLCTAITIGTGGSGGQEGPFAQIGSGVGAILADAFKLSERDRRVLFLSGASAGIGALFTAPLGGALFAPEVLYKKPEFEGDAIIPCIIASIVAYTTFTAITGETRAIPIDMAVIEQLTFRGPTDLPLYLALAIVLTIVGWIWVHVFVGIAAGFKRLRSIPKPLRAGLGGLAVGAIALALSEAPYVGSHGVLFGGYELISSSIHGRIGFYGCLILIGAKILATACCVGSGGSAGLFAPSVAIGALTGAAVGSLGQHLFPLAGFNASSFALVGMGAFFAGVAKVPIAAMLMVCEMTGSYNLLAPLMLVSVLHLLLARNWGIYDTQVEGLKDSPAHAGEFVVDVLEALKVNDVIDRGRPALTVEQDTTLKRALDLVSTASGSYFPVVDGNGLLVGIFSLSDIRRIFLETDVHNLVIVKDFMVDSVATVTADQNLNEALRRLNEYSIHEIPVVSAENPRQVLTMLTRNNIGAAYHRRLRELKRED